MDDKKTTSGMWPHQQNSYIGTYGRLGVRACIRACWSQHITNTFSLLVIVLLSHQCVSCCLQMNKTL